MRRYWPFLIYLAVVAAYLGWVVAQPGVDHMPGKALLMPVLLAVTLVVALGTTPVVVASWRAIVGFVVLCIAIAASCLGDVAMATALQLGLVGLGLAHASYLVLFAWPARARGVRWWVIVYAIAYSVAIALLWPHLGELAPIVAGYGVLLVVAAVLATGVNAVTAVGGALFFASNFGIGVRMFEPGALGFFPDPWQDATLMLLYCAAQGCIAFGVLRRLEREPELAAARKAAAARRRRATYAGSSFERRAGAVDAAAE